MILNYYGRSCFRLMSSSHDVSVLVEPFDASAGWKLPRLTADIVVYSDTSQHHEVPFKTKDGSSPFLVESPGEYEAKDVFIYGIDAEKKAEQAKGSESHTTLFVFGIDDLYVGYLAHIDRVLNEHELDQLGRIDILLVPVGGGDVLGARDAFDVVGQIEPRIIVPMMYALPGLKGGYGGVENFLKEYGAKETGEEEKLKVMKKDLPADETRVIVLKPA